MDKSSSICPDFLILTIMKRKIVLIDDTTEVLDNITEILSLANYQVLSANNGKSGIELAMKEHPDLIICDIMMPELDGFVVLDILRKNSETGSIPFIFLSAKADSSDV